MIAVNMHEAKTRLSALVKAVEAGEVVVLCRAGKQIAEIRPLGKPEAKRRDLTPDPALKPVLATDYDPIEPLSETEWPEELR